MTIFEGLNELEIAEAFAESECHPYDSEDSVSAIFDNHIMPELIEANGKKGEPFDDADMISETFNNWTDMLCKEGHLAECQYKSYCYVGLWSE